MSAENSDDGPKIVWTFPLIRMLTSGSRLINREEGEIALGNNIQTARNKVKQRVDNRRQKFTGTEEEEGGDDELDDIVNQIDELNDSRSFSFEQTDDADADSTVDIEEGVFVPVRTRIDVGDTVVWTNNDDEVHRVLSISGNDFGSGRLEPGDSFSHTFNSEEAVVYVDPITGRQQMCGAVIVGDAELDQQLPCEEEIDAQLFEEEVEYSEGSRSMSQAAQDKDGMDRGF